MAMVQYSGALAPKKKSELQEIATKLSLDIQGTKEDVLARIAKYLDENDLSDNPAFAGLAQHRKRPSRKETNTSSIMPKSITSDDESPSLKRKPSTRRKATPPPPTSEVTSRPFSAPSSPIRNFIDNAGAALGNVLPSSKTISRTAEITGFRLQGRAYTALAKSREFMSNATNISGVTTLVEFLFLLYVMIPWQYYELPVNNPNSSEPASIPYAPLAYLLSGHLYKQLFYWSLPTILAPQAAGALISFTTPRKDVDPLSAGIVKLALAVILDDSWFAVQGRTLSQWRVVGAATSLAFAMAEATEERRVVLREQHRHTLS